MTDTIPDEVIRAMAQEIEGDYDMAPSRDDCTENDIRAALSAADKLGYVLVPREPTEAMLNAAFDVCNLGGDAQPTEIWPEMIAAAPKVTG